MEQKNNEAQDMHDIFVGQGTKMAHAAAQQLQGVTDPKTIGEVLFGIIDRVETEGTKHGLAFDLTTLLHGSMNVMENLVDIAGIELSEDQQKETVGHLVGMYLENAMQTGKLSKEDVVGLAEQAQESQGLISPEESEVR